MTIVNSMSTADFLFCAASVSASREVGDDDEAIGCDGRVAPTVDRDGVCNCDFVGKRFPGADKYLGGVRGSTGVIYAIPGHAKRVLQIDGDDVRLVGPVFEGKYKWLRGVAARDGAVYAIPCHAERVLRIVPPKRPGDDPDVGLVGPKLPGLWKWHGAVEDPASGRIYAIPQSAEQVLRITPGSADGAMEAVVELVGPALPGRWKFYGGLYSQGAIYGVPACATGVLRIGVDAADHPEGVLEDVSLIGDVAAGGWKWHGGCVTADGCVWGIPSNSDAVLKIAPKAGADGEDVVTTVTGPNSLPLRGGSHRSDDKYKYLGGVVASDGCLYCIPSDADQVLKVDPLTSTTSYVGMNLAHLADGQSRGQNKWQNGYSAKADGCVYAIPLKCETVLKIDPTKPPDDCVSTVGGPFPGLNLWEGGVVGDDGALYCMPLKCDRVMRIAPPGTPPIAGAANKQPDNTGPWWTTMVGCL